MVKYNSAKKSGNVREIYIPDCVALALILGVFCGAWGAILGLIAGICMDIHYLFTNSKGFKDERFW